MQLAANTGPKKSPKIRHVRTIAKLCWTVPSQLRHVSTIGKKPVKQQYLLHMSSQYGKSWPTNAGRSVYQFAAPEHISAGFASWQRYCTASAKLCGIEHEGATYIRQGGHHVGHWPTF